MSILQSRALERGSPAQLSHAGLWTWKGPWTRYTNTSSITGGTAEVPASLCSVHRPPQTLAHTHVGGEGAAMARPRGLKGQCTLGKSCVSTGDVPQKSWKERNKILKKRSDGTKVINENKPSTEQALPALAATSGFYLHQWHSVPRNL